ncbi:hypothetical protein DFA_02855 [Cavenderia fasciculata]|uniref:Carbohydrate binding domain-containing protein n=1 Tax=Cavenderia fasciculata TaxID=261658 RepID=F4PIN2_CACFS|nr:uncharacterized protein DFA_03732 [Cavenderia fasciculata]XP_004362463.1 uncharacterized protein DFA_02855 [Cavenderia fasciculata]EGG18245.1 hypothetical protein DFA_03732 [Cavenderia fasciculata]EGG24612.1 hypothetical protein DFA_02855 [Cavenderia fasciculata]|eukprot:XP_004357068.1 hypothetical protein DFA_03732 [Cavenderia fasciculata]
MQFNYLISIIFLCLLAYSPSMGENDGLPKLPSPLLVPQQNIQLTCEDISLLCIQSTPFTIQDTFEGARVCSYAFMDKNGVPCSRSHTVVDGVDQTCPILVSAITKECIRSHDLFNFHVFDLDEPTHFRCFYEGIYSAGDVVRISPDMLLKKNACQ